MKTLIVFILSSLTSFGQFNFTDIAFIGPVNASAPACTNFTIADPTTFTLTQVKDAMNGQYTFGGTLFSFTIYGYRTSGSDTVYSTNGINANFTDNNDLVPFYMTLAWTAIPNATGYVIEVISDSDFSLPAYFIMPTGSTSATIGVTATAYVDEIASYYNSGSPVLTPKFVCR